MSRAVGRPMPEVSERTRPFWDAVRRYRMVIQYCEPCARWQHPPLPVCAGCGTADPGWRPVSGHGVVRAFTVVHRPPLPVFEAPYVIAVVELADARVRVLSNVVDQAPDEIRVGLPVRVTYREELFFFTPTAAAAAAGASVADAAPVGGDGDG